MKMYCSRQKYNGAFEIFAFVTYETSYSQHLGTADLQYTSDATLKSSVK